MIDVKVMTNEERLLKLIKVTMNIIPCNQLSGLEKINLSRLLVDIIDFELSNKSEDKLLELSELNKSFNPSFIYKVHQMEIRPINIYDILIEENTQDKFLVVKSIKDVVHFVFDNFLCYNLTHPSVVFEDSYKNKDTFKLLVY